jgi:aspartyl-tRNA(Asn)/glutamyl-tRNA(Gln) amidotransferase subunit B
MSADGINIDAGLVRHLEELSGLDLDPAERVRMQAHLRRIADFVKHLEDGDSAPRETLSGSELFDRSPASLPTLRADVPSPSLDWRIARSLSARADSRYFRTPAVFDAAPPEDPGVEAAAPAADSPGAAREYEARIGLEVHAQLWTATKLFCGCRNDFGAEPNTLTCPVCLGLPGILPALNRKAVELALRVALALRSRIASHSVFARKNYFYPDLPKNYQITQYERPLARGGWLELEAAASGRRIGIERIHLEEDAGRLLHGSDRAVGTRIDLNRAGVPLIEIVTEPAIASGPEAAVCLRILRRLLRYLGACAGNLEEGHLRCDANVSVRRRGASGLGAKTEIKNLNSFRAIARAIDEEIARQVALLRTGRVIRRETRCWDAGAGQTVFLRSKEEAHDYRYFPEPDLPPLRLSGPATEEIRRALPELPAARIMRFVAQYGLRRPDAETLAETPQLADYFESTARTLGDPRLSAHWVRTEILAILREKNISLDDFPVSPTETAKLLSLVRERTLSRQLAKTIFLEMIRTGRTPAEISRSWNLWQVSDRSAIRAVVRRVLTDHPAEARELLKGKNKLNKFFMGRIMLAFQGQADPRLAAEVLGEEIKNFRPDSGP